MDSPVLKSEYKIATVFLYDREKYVVPEVI